MENLTPELLAHRWGWPEPSEAVVEQATLALALRALRVGDAAVHLGLCGEDEKERLLRGKPNGVLTLEYLAGHLPRVREGMQRLLALHDGLPYLETMEGLQRHAHLEREPVLRRCEELDAVMLQAESGASILVFAEFRRLDQFRRMGRPARRNDALWMLSREEGGELLFAVGDITLIRAAQRPTEGEEVALKGTVVEQARVWRATQAMGEAQRLLARILDTAVAHGATDLDIWPQADGVAEVKYRVAGLLRPMATVRRLGWEDYDEIRAFLLARSGANTGGGRLQRDADGEFSYRSVATETHVRGSFIPRSLPGEPRELVSISLRLIPRRTAGDERSIKQLGLHPTTQAAFRHVIEHQRDGLVAIVGPTNSGKSTSIASVLVELDRHHAGSRKIVSLEDPVEQTIPGVRQFQVPAHQGDDGYPNALRALMRHDPDIIAVGEIRDRVTALVAGKAAATGHLVATTLHATDTVTGALYLLSMVREPELRFALVNALRLIVAQRMVPRLCPHCHGGRPLSEQDRADWVRAALERGIDPEGIVLPEKVPVVGEGCGKCRHGYVGQIPLSEVLAVTPEVRHLLLTDDAAGKLALGRLRRLTLYESALALIDQREIAWDSLWV